jgi:hypothetical protein
MRRQANVSRGQPSARRNCANKSFPSHGDGPSARECKTRTSSQRPRAESVVVGYCRLFNLSLLAAAAAAAAAAKTIERRARACRSAATRRSSWRHYRIPHAGHTSLLMRGGWAALDDDRRFRSEENSRWIWKQSSFSARSFGCDVLSRFSRVGWQAELLLPPPPLLLLRYDARTAADCSAVNIRPKD